MKAREGLPEGPPIDFMDFLNRTMDYIERKKGRDTAIITDLLNLLENQIKFWLANPPEDPQYAANVMHAVINASLPNDEIYRPYKAKLCYMRGLIHQNGFDGINAKPKQALMDFKDATHFGSTEAWEKLGDCYFEQARKLPPPVSSHPVFIDALMAYSNGDDKAKIKHVENILMTTYSDAILKGNIDEAMDAIKLIMTFIRQNPDLSFNKNLAALNEQIPVLANLKLLMADAQEISAAFLLAINARDVNEMEAQLLAIKSKLRLPNAPNPVFDYYHALILKKMASLLSNDRNVPPGKIKSLNARAEELFEQILTDDTYPDFYQPLVNFVKGLGMIERVPNFTALSLRAHAYFNAAAKQGCFLAYSYMGNIIGEEKGEEQAEPYYSLGAFAGDARCQITYFNRYLSKKLQQQLRSKEPDSKAIIALAEKTLSLLEQTLKNPFILDDQKSYVLAQRNEIILILGQYSDTPDILSVNKSWRSYAHSRELKPLIDAISRYESLLNTQFTERINALEAILKIRENLVKDPKVPQDIIKLLAQLDSKTNNALDYLYRKKYEHELDVLAKMPPKARLQAFLRFMSDRGHMDHKYYMEYLDPMHRKPELLLRYLKTAGSKNYFKWLQTFDSYNTDQVERVRYLDEEARRNFHVVLSSQNQLEYDAAKKSVPDGQYLYALDRGNHLYLASEAQESIGVRHFHHSSFKGGTPVLSSGEIVIKNGKIASINNYSGHYMPDIYRLFKAILRLRKAKMLADDFRIGLVGVAIPPGVNVDAKNLTLDQFLGLLFMYTTGKNKKITASQQLPIQEALPAASIKERIEMQKVREQIEDYIQSQIRHKVEAYANLKPPAQFKEQIFTMLKNDEEVAGYIKRIVSEKQLGLITRLFNNLTSPDGRPLEEFAAGYVRAIEEGKFVEWTIYKTHYLMSTLLGKDNRLNDEMLTMFAAQSGESKENILKKFYGQPPDPKKIQEVADLIKSACMLGVSIVFAEAVRKGRDPGETNETFKKLAKYSYLVTGITHEGELIDENVITFRKLAVEPLYKFESGLAKMNVETVAGIELRALKSTILTKESELNELLNDKQKLSGTRISRSGAFGIDQHVKAQKQVLAGLEERENILLGVLAAALPRRSTIIEGFREKFKFYEKLCVMLDVDGKTTIEDINVFNQHLRFQIESVITDDKVFSHKCNELDTVIIKRLEAILKGHPYMAGRDFMNEFHVINNRFYNTCKPAQYRDAKTYLQNQLANLALRVPRPEIGPRTSSV